MKAPIGQSGKLFCLLGSVTQNMQRMHCNIPFMFDYGADLVLHLILPEISMIALTSRTLERCGSDRPDFRRIPEDKEIKIMTFI